MPSRITTSVVSGGFASWVPPFHYTRSDSQYRGPVLGPSGTSPRVCSLNCMCFANADVVAGPTTARRRSSRVAANVRLGQSDDERMSAGAGDSAASIALAGTLLHSRLFDDLIVHGATRTSSTVVCSAFCTKIGTAALAPPVASGAAASAPLAASDVIGEELRSALHGCTYS
jgi:hypothetical protein